LVESESESERDRERERVCIYIYMCGGFAQNKEVLTDQPLTSTREREEEEGGKWGEDRRF
jgi:hypothetical protein